MPTLLELLNNHRVNPKDKRVFGLVLQSGGMRGVYSAAALAKFVNYGFCDTFDHVVGSSAGGLNGAYFIAGQVDAKDVYIEDLTNKKFVNLARIDKKVDVDYAIDIALREMKPLHVDKLLQAHSKLHIVLTDEKSGRKEVISEHNRFKEIYEELRATAALPILYDKIISVNEDLYIDGGVSDNLPVDVAVELGCTDIVVIMNRRVSSYRFDAKHTQLAKRMMYRLARNHSEAVRKILPTNEKEIKRNLKFIALPPADKRVYLLEPSKEEMLITIATIDKEKIEALAKLGAHDAEAFLHQEIS